MSVERQIPCLVACLVIAGTASAQSYTVVDLSNPVFAKFSLTGTDGAQQVGGSLAPQQHALVWAGTADSLADLNPAGFTSSIAAAVAGGEQVGSGNNGRATHALLWSGTAGSVIDLHPAGFASSFAQGISDGQQAGYGTLQQKGVASPAALLWSGSAGTAVNLTPSNATQAQAFGVFDGRQAGSATVIDATGTSTHHALLWTSTAASAVDLNPPGLSPFSVDAVASEALGIGAGQQVGDANFTSAPDVSHAAVWSGAPGTAVDLHPAGLDPSDSSSAAATSGDQQVGDVLVGPPGAQHPHAYVWSGTAASGVDLSQFLPAGTLDSRATGIAAGGTIVGTADGHPVMWIPAAPVQSATLTLDQSVVQGGQAVVGVISLHSPAPPGGATVSLSEIDASGPVPTGFHQTTVVLPPSVTIPAGKISAPVSFPTAAGGNAEVGIVTSYAGVTKTAVVGVAAAAPSPTGVAFASSSVSAFTSLQGTLTLSGPAPKGGMLLKLSSSDAAAAAAPASVFVQAGSTSAPFSVPTNPVASATPVSLTAGNGAAAASGAATVNPNATDVQVGGSARSGGPAVGSADSFTWQVRNGGSQVAGDVAFTDALPPALEFQSVSSSAGVCSAPPAGSLGGKVACTLKQLPVGQTLVVTINTTVLAAGAIANTGSATFVGSDTNAGNNSSTVTIQGR